MDVRLLLPGPVIDHPSVPHAGRRHYARLLCAGVRIFEYERRFRHAKAVLCDRWASVGSSSLDRRALRRNLEANREVEDADFAHAPEAGFRADLVASVEIDPARRRRCRRQTRALEWLVDRIEAWLIRLRPGRRR